MKYTHYFGIIIRDQGAINLSPSEFQRMMNIVHLEGVKYGLQLAKETYKDSNLYYRYDTLISKYESQLSVLTSNDSPETLLYKMVSVIE